MNRNIELIEKLMHISNKINERGKKPKYYGTDDLLYQSEIHTIRTIKLYPHANASMLADILGITNGAITQVISKLLKKGLVEKYNLDNNKKSVYFTLTDKGNIVYENHELSDRKLMQQVLSYLDNQDCEKIKAINNFLNKVSEYLE